MARPAAYTGTLLACVRQYYGLHQRELAALLGISNAHAHYLETGRRPFTRAVSERLTPFLAPVPGAAEAAAQLLAEVQAQADLSAPLPTPPPGFFDTAPLVRRRAACLHEAQMLRYRLLKLPAQAALAARWAEAMPALLAALGPPPPAHEAPTTREAVRLRYVHSWLATVPLALPPDVLAQWHLAHQRLLALEAEAAALAALLAARQ